MSRFVIRPIVFASFLLSGAVAAHAQVVTAVKAADHLVVHNFGEIRLLGVKGLGTPAPGTPEAQCAETTRAMVYGLIHTKEVRLVLDDRAKKQPALAMHRYVYMPDGRMLNSVVLETGCARLAAGVDELQFGAMFKSLATHAQNSKRGLYGAPGAPMTMPAASASAAPRPAPSVSLASFNRITLGMSLADVNAILGAGKETSRFESSSFTVTTFEWSASEGLASIIIGFQNGKVSTKHQFGLQ